MVAWYWYQRQANLAQSLFESPALAFQAVGMLSLPLSMTYVVLRHRVFDISFIIRQGLRYALARRLLLSLLPALIAVLAFDVLAHGHETIHAVLRQRGPLYAGVSTLALAVYMSRQRWLDALDRRFFRERQDGYAVLREVAEHLRRGGSLDRVAPRVVATIESAMHPEFAALLVHAGVDAVFRTIAAVPAAGAVADLSADSKLVALARVLEQPIDTSCDGDAILRQLPAAELEFVGRAGWISSCRLWRPTTSCLACWRSGARAPKTVLARRPECSRHHRRKRGAAGSEIGRRTRVPAFEECLECGACFDAGVRICGRDSRPL